MHSALSGKASELRGIPFARASVEIGEVRSISGAGDDFFGDLTRHTLAETPSAGQLPLPLEMQEVLRKEGAGKKVWYSFEPAIEDQSFEIRHTYLPISRLYVNDDRRLPRTLRDSVRGSLLSESALERVFAEIVNFLWLRYTRNTSLEIQEVQSNGIYEILGHFLAPGEESQEPYDVDAKEAYKRLQAFLGRQQNFVTITESELAKRIKEDRRMQRVLKDIEDVEAEVARIRRPKDEFDRILRQMISPEKTVQLGNRDIHAYAEEEEIELGDLSSGEKQLLRICIDVLLSDRTSVLIDEPELSMHIDWQRRLIPALRALAPESQLIIATHSPEIMVPLKEHQIFEL